MIDILDSYVATFEPPDIVGARRLAIRTLDEGMAATAFIEEIIRPAQVEVGRRWQVGEWTIAQEHAATAITDSVLAAVSLRTAAEPSIPGRVVTACVENEWHTMPLRMLNDCLAATGHDVVFLGPSLPSTHLAGFVADVEPVAVLLSCTYPLNLPGARRSVQAAHDASVPVIIGGRALDAAGVRAAALGADAYADDAVRAASILADWASARPNLAVSDGVAPEQAELEMPTSGLVEDCLRELMQRQPRLRSMTDRQLTRTREDITYILGICSAAMVSHDSTVLDVFTLWLRDLLAPPNIPADTIKAYYEAIAAVLGDGFPEAITMLAASSALI